MFNGDAVFVLEVLNVNYVVVVGAVLIGLWIKLWMWVVVVAVVSSCSSDYCRNSAKFMI